MISERREPLAVSFCISDFKRDVLSLNITKLAEPLPKSVKKSGRWEFRGQNANSVKFTACCAPAISGHAAAAPPRSLMKSRRCMCAPVWTTPCAMLDYKRSLLIGV